MNVPWDLLQYRKQYRGPGKVKQLRIIGLDTETNPKVNKTELLCADTGDWLLPTSFEDIMHFCFQKKFRGACFVFYNLQFDVQGMLKWLPSPLTMKQPKFERVNRWIVKMGGLRIAWDSGELKRIRKSLPIGFLRHGSPWALDTILHEAVNEGFLMPGANDGDLYALIEKDTREPVYRASDYESDAWIQWQQYQEYQGETYWQELWDTGETEFERWTLRLIPWKLFTVRWKDRKHAIKFFDISQFFEKMTLNSAVRRYLGKKKLDTVDRTRIKVFSDPEVIRYCVQDAILAGDLTRFVLDLHDTHFNGSPVSLISKASLSEKHFSQVCQIPTLNDVMEKLPEAVRFAYEAYKGGFFQVYKRGSFPEVYVYDINSAYPYQMARLPDLSRGRFVKYRKRPPDGSYLGWLEVQVNVYGSHAYYSPLAVELRGIHYYPKGMFRTIVTLEEYRELDRYFDLEPLTGYYWIPGNELVFPYREEIERLYEWKRDETDPALRMFIKIVLNSIYGKTIQKVPDKLRARYVTGNLFNPFYASYITGGTRLQLFDRLKNLDKRSLVMVATDSIMSQNPLDIPNEKTMGTWALEKSGPACVIGTGVYTVKSDKGIETKNRGFRPTDRINFLDMTGNDTVIDLTITAHISLARALIQKDYERMNLILNETRSLDINFDKRRFWFGRFKNVSELSQKILDSDPWIYDMIETVHRK